MFLRNGILRVLSSVALVVACAGDIRSGAAQSAQARAVRPISAVGDLIDVTKAIDDRDNTRAHAGTSNYAGLSITVDVGGLNNTIGVIQDHGQWAADYPGSYKVEIAESAEGPWLTAFEGQGRRGESRALFEAVRGRFGRVTATNKKGGGIDWSVAEVKVIIDPGATARRIPKVD